jgi:hypothetical protein
MPKRVVDRRLYLAAPRFVRRGKTPVREAGAAGSLLPDLEKLPAVVHDEELAVDAFAE